MTDDTTGIDFQVRRDDLRQHRFVPMGAPELTLQPGQALLRIDRFAFTANNVTYAVAGDMLYWKFFPAPEGWGHVPVWGFADVVASRSDAAPEGLRVYGYFPVSTHLVVEPKGSGAGFTDASAHRAELPFVYNSYASAPTGASAQEEAMAALFRPLFTTSFVLDHFIAANDGFGTDTVIVGSASSKTAFGMAYLLAKRDGVRSVGLTSGSNREFVEGLGCYDEVLTYDALETLPADRPSVYVDMSGNTEVLSRLHHHLGDNMKHSAQVGVTHWEQRADVGALPGAPPAFFFAPTYIGELLKEHGPAGFNRMLDEALESVTARLSGAIEVEEGRGRGDVARVYDTTLDGKTSPAVGHMLSMWEDA